MRSSPSILFYSTPREFLSPWFSSRFVLYDPLLVRDVMFESVSQYLIYSKAKLFADMEMAQKVLAAKSPREILLVSEEIPECDSETWKSHARGYAFTGHKAKYSQNIKLLLELLQTRGMLIAQATEDELWGVGILVHDPRVKDPANWTGLNWSGEVIEEVRDHLYEEVQAGRLRLPRWASI